MRSLLCQLLVLAALGLPLAAEAGGVRFLGEKCAFDHRPQTGWIVAPPAERKDGNRLLRASHDPRLGLALEAWAGPMLADGGDDALPPEDAQRAALEARGWTVLRSDRAAVGALQARRTRAHRRDAGQVFVLDEYQFEAAGRPFTLRVTARGVGALQSPHVTRWLASFRLL